MMKSAVLFLCLFLILFAGCSKPSAQEYFARGQRALLDAQHAVDTMRVARDTRPLFQQALDAFTSVTTEYPKDSLAEQALFAIATIRNNDTHEPQLAVDGLKKYIDLYPDSKRTPMAMFLVGYLYNNELHDTLQAGVAYRRFLEKFPNDEMTRSAEAELRTLGKPPEELIPSDVAESKPAPKKESPRKPSHQHRTK